MKLTCPVDGGRVYTVYIQLQDPKTKRRSFLPIASYFVCEKASCMLWVPDRDMMIGPHEVGDLARAVHLKVPEIPDSLEAMIQRPARGRRPGHS